MIAIEGKRYYGEISDPGKRRGFGANTLDEGCDLRPLDVDQHAFAAVRYISPEVQGSGKFIDKGPETNPLDHSFDYDLSPLNHVAHASIPALLVQETSKIFSFGLSARESFRTLRMSVFI